MDALDRVWKPFGKKQKAEFAKKKAEQDERETLKDKDKVSKISMAFRARIAEEIKRLGLC